MSVVEVFCDKSMKQMLMTGCVCEGNVVTRYVQMTSARLQRPHRTQARCSVPASQMTRSEITASAPSAVIQTTRWLFPPRKSTLVGLWAAGTHPTSTCPTPCRLVGVSRQYFLLSLSFLPSSCGGKSPILLIAPVIAPAPCEGYCPILVVPVISSAAL